VAELEPLGGPLVGDPGVAANWYGGLEVFGRGLNGTLWHIWQTDPANDQWSNWNDLGGGGIVGNPAVAANADGRWRCSSGPERSLAYLANRPTESAMVRVGGPGRRWMAGVPAVASNVDGRLEVFARTTDGSLWRIC